MLTVSPKKEIFGFRDPSEAATAGPQCIPTRIWIGGRDALLMNGDTSLDRRKRVSCSAVS